MESQIQSEKEPGNSNKTLIFAAIAAIALCCCLVVVGAVGFYTLSAVGSGGAPQQPADELAPPSNSTANVPPSGGLANETLKNDVWDLMKLGAVSMGCQRPTGSGLSIVVLQNPGSGGVWMEKWPVRCASGDVREFEVEFIPDDTGVTFNIRQIP